MSQSRKLRRANGIKTPTVKEAINSDTPLNSLYALIPENRRKALDCFLHLFGKSRTDLHEALERERK